MKFSMDIYNQRTRYVSGPIEWGKIKEITNTLENKVELTPDKEIPNYISRVDHNVLTTEKEFTCDVDINYGLLSKLLGLDYSNSSDFTIEMNCEPYLVQKRKHKKKRINKKWAKRYGYVTKFKNIILKDIMLNSNSDGMIDIYGYRKVKGE